jgi:hypothetical protein
VHNKNQELNSPGDRLKYVIKTWLGAKGVMQKSIAEAIDEDSYSFSKLYKNKQSIPDSLLIYLHEKYDINPKYIIDGAPNILDIPHLKYDAFTKFVDRWDLVSHEIYPPDATGKREKKEEKEFLHFYMDEFFYKFLINIYKYKEASNNTDDEMKLTEATESAIETLKNSYESGSSCEYVLIPADDLKEISTDNIPARKNINAFIDCLKY